MADNYADGREDDKPDPAAAPRPTPYGAWAGALLQDDPSRLALLGMVPEDARTPQRVPPLWVPMLVRTDLAAIEDILSAQDQQNYRTRPPLALDRFQLFLPRLAQNATADLVIYAQIKSGRLVQPLPAGTKVLASWAAVPASVVPKSDDPALSDGMMFEDKPLFGGGGRRRRSGSETMVGVIDDGIGFLNGRFMRATKTRFKAFWMQSVLPPAAPTPLPTLSALAASVQKISEAEAYRDLARQVYAAGTGHRLLDLETHGTHMLDLAAGADPFAASAVRDVDLLGVQVPPAAYDDTSGAMLEPYLLSGLQFLATSAILLGAKRLMVNVSLGITAGPKDGTSDLEVGLAHVIALAKGAGLDEMTVFLPYGNSYEDQLAAELDVAAAASWSDPIDWQVQPGDLTPGYFEIRLRAPDAAASADLADLRYKVSAPDGTTLTLPALGPGSPDAAIVVAGKTCGSVSYVAANGMTGQAAHVVVAFAPSRANPDAAGPTTFLCQTGRWRLRMKAGATPLPLTVQMQRDDRPAGAPAGIRQAYFTGRNTRDFDAERRDHTGEGPGGPVVRRGTNSAYATVASGDVVSVGGALVRPNQDGADLEISAARYASEGAIWSGGGPDRSAVAETEASTPGVTAAGTFSGGAARLSGSSTASATALRQALEAALGVPTVANVAAPTAALAARLGGAVVTGNGTFRSR